jgi:repressor LexA
MTYPKGEERLQQTAGFLIQFKEEHGFSPTYDEICAGTGVKSKSHARKLVDKLVERGLIERDPFKARNIRILDEAYEFVNALANNVVRRLEEIVVIPLAGRIVASAPVPVPVSDLSYYDSESSIELLRSTLPPNEKIEELFALEVQGDSMIDAMINDGDTIIMRQANDARNGEMVAVWLDENNETTLKYFFREGSGKSARIRLQPANPTMQPIYVDNPRQVRIMGKVVMVMRQVPSFLM